MQPYGYLVVGSLNVLRVRLGNSSVKHIRVIGGVEQLQIHGQTTTSAYTAAAAYTPVIISVEQSTLRDIRFVGENSRPFILSIGPGGGLPLYMSFESDSLVGGGPARWRMQLVNENRALWMEAKTGNGVLITGALRTNWQVNCANGGPSVRFTWDRETEPDRLVPFMPRDGWLETYTALAP